MNKTLKYLIYTSFLLFPTFQASPKDINVVVLDEAQVIKRLYEKNKTLISSKERLNISDAELINAGLFPNHNFLLDFSPVQNTYRVGVGSLIELGDKRNLRIDVAKQKKEINNISFLIELRDMKYKSLSEFYKIIYLRNKQLKINELIVVSEKLELACCV